MPTYECPTCRQTIRVDHRDQAPHRPFCSRRCQMIDLAKWFDGDYCISEPLDPTQDDPTPNSEYPTD